MRLSTKSKKKTILKYPKVKHRQEKWTQRKADELFSKIVRLERGTCQAKHYDRCNCGGGLQCAHIVTRGYSATRYERDGVLVLCAGHHRFFHSNPHLWWTDFLPTYFPKQLEFAKTNAKPIEKKLNYKDLILSLRQQLTTLQQQENM